MEKNINPNPERSLTQRQQILELLQAGYSLTPLDALRLVGTTKLATRISELINEDGHTEIIKERVSVKTANGKHASVMQYCIPTSA